MKFSDLQFKSHSADRDGIQAIHNFDNGYGVSVVKANFSYGGLKGLYEMAVLWKGKITYDSGITDDVLGHLTPEDVERHLAEVEALPVKSI
jgi:hypothetical protein